MTKKSTPRRLLESVFHSFWERGGRGLWFGGVVERSARAEGAVNKTCSSQKDIHNHQKES